MNKYRIGLLSDICRGEEMNHQVIGNFSRSWEVREEAAAKEDFHKSWTSWYEKLTEEVCSVAEEYL